MGIVAPFVLTFPDCLHVSPVAHGAPADAIRTQLFQAHLVAVLVSFLIIGHMCAVWAAPNAQAEADAVEDAYQHKLRAAHAAAAAGKKKQ